MRNPGANRGHQHHDRQGRLQFAIDDVIDTPLYFLEMLLESGEALQ